MSRPPLNSLNRRSTNRNDPVYDRGTNSPLLVGYQKALQASELEGSGVLRIATVDKILWSPKNGAPTGVYGCVVSLDTDLAYTTEKVPAGTASRSHAVQKFTKFKVEGSCSSAPKINQKLEVYIVEDSPDLTGTIVQVLNDFVDGPITSDVGGKTSAKDTAQKGESGQTPLNNPTGD